MTILDRRAAVAGLGATIATCAYAEDKSASPLAHGVLAENSLAQKFEGVSTKLPDVNLWGPNGKRDIEDWLATLKGRTILMPLWAEWCAPCMSEIPDFARLQQKYGNDKFSIIPVLTATRKQFTPEILGSILKSMHAGVFEPLIENHLGDTLMTRMARIGSGAALPCNLLIAPDGRVLAREIGRLGNTDDASPAKTWDAVVKRAETGDVQSRWGQADGDAFAAAMASGFLA
ncbi:MAG TPA: TlpA disulfide reductase family protein [Rhizomicrobium sp.]|nr:TlpA disulfide reductase family protein [Rhizomicrobium sp.]